MDILQIIFFAVAIFLFVYFLLLQPHKIKGNSMLPNFLNGEFLLTDKVTYRFNDAKRGDVVVFKAPPDERDEFIKRIIGLPTERVALINGHIYINGKLLKEKYLDESLFTNAGGFLSEGEEVIVPKEEYFVLGDNRQNSSDSRSWGSIKKDKITGRAWLIYWPISKTGMVPSFNYQ